jgi:hypothetical protein
MDSAEWIVAGAIRLLRPSIAPNGPSIAPNGPKRSREPNAADNLYCGLVCGDSQFHIRLVFKISKCLAPVPATCPSWNVRVASSLELSPSMPKKSKKADPKKAAKLAAKKAAEAAEKAMRETLRAAKAAKDPLSALPAPFTAFSRNGLQCAFEYHTPETLPPADLAQLHRLMRAEAAAAAGEGADSRTSTVRQQQQQLADDDARLLLVRATAAPEPATPAATAGAGAPPSPATSPVKEAAEIEAEEAAKVVSGEEEKEAAAEGAGAGAGEELKAGAVAAFVHLRYENDEGALLLKIVGIHVSAAARRRGLGKFATMLCEMLGRKAGMAGAMFALPLHASQEATAFCASCKYGVDPLSPSRINPTAEQQASKPELLSKIWDPGTQAARSKLGVDTATRLSKAKTAKDKNAVIGNRSIDACGAN